MTQKVGQRLSLTTDWRVGDTTSACCHDKFLNKHRASRISPSELVKRGLLYEAIGSV